MSGETNLNKLIATMQPSLAEHCYVFGTIASGELAEVIKYDPISIFQEQEGLTVILTKEKAEALQMPYSGVFKCITLNVHSSLDAVGLTAAVASQLTHYNISANVVAAYYHDHIFVSVKDADTALMALKELALTGSHK